MEPIDKRLARTHESQTNIAMEITYCFKYFFRGNVKPLNH